MQSSSTWAKLQEGAHMRGVAEVELYYKNNLGDQHEAVMLRTITSYSDSLEQTIKQKIESFYNVRSHSSYNLAWLEQNCIKKADALI